METNAFFLVSVYIVGLLATLAFFIIFGRKLGIDFDGKRSYANYDDWGSNASAYVAWSCVWFVVVPIAAIVAAYLFLVYCVDILSRKKVKDKPVKIGVILAVGENGELGRNNDLLWKQKADMQHFKEKTVGCPVVMGRNTWESLPPRFRPLPDRPNVVVTSGEVSGVSTARSIDEAIEQIRKYYVEGTIWIIGGASMYKEALRKADIISITRIHASFDDADVLLPESMYLEKFGFELVGRGDKMPADEYNEYPYTFMEYKK
jgi:dihydrofolate reductase